MNITHKSATKLAFLEFAIVFASEIAWNLLRKTGQNIFDSFGIAVVTAVLLYLVQRPDSS